MKRAALVLGIALWASGCRHFGFHDHPVAVDRDTVVTEDGVHYEDLFVGQGAIAGGGDEVLLDYTVWTDDDSRERIDSTLDRGVPVRVRIGSAFVDGLNSGLMSIRPGGRRRVHVPARQAYGARGVEGLVPPDADLVFEVHAIEVRPSTP